MKRITYLATAALVTMLTLASTAMAQDMAPGDDDPFLPEQNVTMVQDDELQQMVGQLHPKQIPDEPVDELQRCADQLSLSWSRRCNS